MAANLKINQHQQQTSNLFNIVSFLISTSIFSQVLFNHQASGAENITKFPTGNQSSYQWNNLAVDQTTETVYAGAVNRLFQFDGNLTLLNAVETGPVLDNPRCYNNFNNNPCLSADSVNVSTSQTDNYNQVIVVDIRHGQLVTCGNVFQGTCQTRNLSNISISTSYPSQFSQYVIVASSDPQYPTVAIVAPGPFGDDVLYVGTDFTSPIGSLSTEWQLGKYLAGVSGRNLTGNGAFLVTEVEDRSSYGTRAYLTQQAATLYKIIYVAGFNVSGFTYLLTRQPDPFSVSPVSDVIISKLVQVCQNDKYFDSYVEMPIICSSSSKNYKLVQAATFIQPGSSLALHLGISTDDYVMIAVFSSSYSSDDESAVCVYTLKDIRRTFTQNILKCYNSSTDKVGPQFDSSERYCFPFPASINDSYCGSMFPILSRLSIPRNSPLVGTIPLSSSAAVLILPIIITAIASTDVDSHTILFLGTKDGNIIKVLLDSTNATIYETFSVGSSAINQDMVFNGDKSHLYVMTSNMIYKIPVSDCEQYITCDACLSTKDPYCGWCTLQNSCRQQSKCQDNQLTFRWIAFYSTNPLPVCPIILSVEPSNTDISENINVTLNLVSLPVPQSLFEYYVCTFGSESFISNATYISLFDQLVCPTPQNKPLIPQTNDNVVVSLSVKMLSSSSVSFIQTLFTFYDCNHHTTCSGCLQTIWSCCWCLFTNECQKTSLLCSQDNSQILDKQFCPRLQTNTTEILIAAGIETFIQLSAVNLPLSQDYYCLIESSDQPLITLPATQLNSSLLTCSSHLFTSLSSSPYPASLTVVWGSQSYTIEGTAGVTVFNCSALANRDCNRCFSLQLTPLTAKYGCLWCSDTCQPNITTCDSLTTFETKCPRAVINSINPLSGPKEGGTLVTIKGTNLGYMFDQVQIYIGNKICQGIEEDYIISQQYVCVTNGVNSIGSQIINVTVANIAADQSVDNSLNYFVYKEPAISDVEPKLGPIAGGTPLTIQGTNLNIGSNVTVWIGQEQCYLGLGLKSSENILFCQTTQHDVSKKATDVTVLIDRAILRPNIEFTFTENPTAFDTIPTGSFKAGGCIVSVPVNNLNSIVNIGINLTNRVYAVSSNVIFRNSSLLQFLSPTVDTTTSSSPFELILTLDAIELKLSFFVYSDPIVESFDKRFYGGDTLQIQGHNMTTPCMDNYQSEVSVYVGTQTCNISSLTDTSLYCKPPDRSPDGGTQEKVIVKVGYLSFLVGDLIYPSDESSIIWQVSVAVIGGVLVVVILILVLVFYRKSSENERKYRKLQAQMDALESSVRNECKQAFTELQTDVSDFTSDLNVIGIPFWDFKMYAFKLMFPMIDDHQILYVNNNSGNQMGEFGEKMHKFNQLLSSRYFLLTFIHTMEKQPHSFRITDRSKVASLLSVVLIDKMEYATEIMKILLNELITKSLDKKAPKLMLRRAETVVEKLLSNWLSLSMYGYLRANSGRALFMLYKAIKHQTEKGPIDAVTGEARYSLSENRLLRDKIEAKTLNVYVSNGDNRDQAPVLCKMLDCDTITQAKEKALDAIYMNSPFSKRPSKYNVELKLSAGGQRECLPLNDQDVTTKIVDGWKKINTLSHYYINDGALLSIHHLQQRENNKHHDSSIQQVHGMIELDSGTLLNKIRLEEGAKVWHHVKPDDNLNNMNRAHKVISEIFLTRLLSSKMPLQDYIDDLFKTMLKVDDLLPPTIKYLFDFLDNAAQMHGITDAEVVHAWKSNSLPLRFWVNLITNPEFLFDINKSPVVHCCLSDIAQTFMDSCSTHEHLLGKESPSTKLLFAKDIPRYRQLVIQFYRDVKSLPAINDDVMAMMMTDHSQRYSTDFNQEVALQELFDYALRFDSELSSALENDSSARRLGLAQQFEQLKQYGNYDELSTTSVI